MFALEVEYLLGRVHASEFQDGRSPEWPPHPGRLFSALAAAYFECGAAEREQSALRWLETQPPPGIRADSPGESNSPTVFVPTNYAGDTVPVMRRKQPRYFAAQSPASATVYFVWPHAAPDAGTVAALEGLSERTAALGRASSVVRVRTTDQPKEPNYIPREGGGEVLRVPSAGRLEELRWLYEANRRPNAGAVATYSKVDQLEDAEAVAQSEFGFMAVLRKVSGPGLPVEATLTVATAARSALMAAGSRAGLSIDLIAGHAGGTHCAIVGLPFVGQKHADGRLLGIGVVLPRNATPSERRDVMGACGELARNGLHIPGIGDWALEALDSPPLQYNLRAATWARPSLRWKTVTPVLLDRFPKRNGPSVEDILARACQRIGLPTPARIEHGPYSDLEAVPRVPACRLQRRHDDPPRWGVHVHLEFTAAVAGPVVLGAGRYFGLGLMRPVEGGGA